MATCRYCFWVGALGAITVLIATAIVRPMYSDYTGRSKASEMLKLAMALKQQIEPRILQHKSIQNAGVGIAPDLPQTATSSIAQAHILQDGTIVLQGHHFGQVLVLMPSLVNQQVVWRCLGGSAKDVPPQCRIQANPLAAQSNPPPLPSAN